MGGAMGGAMGGNNRNQMDDIDLPAIGERGDLGFREGGGGGGHGGRQGEGQGEGHEGGHVNRGGGGPREKVKGDFSRLAEISY